MKVILPVSMDTEGKIIVAQGFHNTKNVCIYNYLEDEFEYIPINKIRNNIGDFSIELKLSGIDFVISRSMPPHALKVFKTNGLSVFKAEGTSLEDNIEYFQNNRLNLFTNEELSRATGCVSKCSTCSTTCK